MCRSKTQPARYAVRGSRPCVGRTGMTGACAAAVRPSESRSPEGLLPLLTLLLPLLGGCVQRMSDQPRIEPLEASEFFHDQMGSRPPVPGTIARGPSRHEIVTESDHFLTGMVDGVVSDELPPEVVARWSLNETLSRGQQRFRVYCVYCHDAVGTGHGVVPQRGYPAPPTYHSQRVRDLPLGTIFRVITDGKGRMPPYGPIVAEADRWAIAAYIRTLQFSQYASPSELQPRDQEAIESLDGGPSGALRGEAR